MNMQKMIEFRRKIEEGKIKQDSPEIDEYLEGTDTYLNERTNQGQDVILRKMKEDDFVTLIDEVENLITSSMASEGYGMFLQLAKQDEHTQCSLLFLQSSLTRKSLPHDQRRTHRNRQEAPRLLV
jgi:hypothetical protein